MSKKAPAAAVTPLAYSLRLAAHKVVIVDGLDTIGELNVYRRLRWPVYLELPATRGSALTPRGLMHADQATMAELRASLQLERRRPALSWRREWIEWALSIHGDLLSRGLTIGQIGQLRSRIAHVQEVQA